MRLSIKSAVTRNSSYILSIIELRLFSQKRQIKKAQNRNRTRDTSILRPLHKQLRNLGIRCIATTSNILLYKVLFVNMK